MNNKIMKIAHFSAVGICSFYIGIHYEKKYSQKCSLQKFESMPGLPVFGTVSAASPFVENNSSRISQIMKYGFPSLDNVRSYDDYVLAYDRRNRIAYWVFEHITKDHIRKNPAVDRARCEFQPDEAIHPLFRSQNSDYKSSGFDRGHMAAAANHKLSQKHIDQTFYLTNMAPQVGQGFNRDAWNDLEVHVRKLTNKFDNVYCCTGPLYLPRREADGKNYVRYQVIGANNVAVPTHFYKVVVGESKDGALELESYVMPNQSIPDGTPVEVFQVPPETIEKAAGLLFFDKINRNKLTRINGKNV